MPTIKNKTFNLKEKSGLLRFPRKLDYFQNPFADENTSLLLCRSILQSSTSKHKKEGLDDAAE